MASSTSSARVPARHRLHEHGGHAGQQPVDDEAGRVADEHAALLQLLHDVPCGDELLVGRPRGAHDLDERHDRHGVEEVQADVGAHSLDRERRRVRREDRVRRRLARRGENLALHVHLLEHRLEDQVAAGEVLPAGSAFDDRPEERLDLVADRLQGFVDARLVEVAQHDRHLEPSQEQRRELRRHEPSADDADLLHRARLRVGKIRRPLRAPFDDGERVRGRLRLRRDEQLGHRVLFGGIAFVDRPVARAGDEIERDVGRARRAVHRVVDLRARLAHHGLELRPVGLRALERQRLRERERLVHELDGIEHAVGDAELDRVLGFQQPVLAQRIEDDHLRGGFRPDEAREELRPAPAGNDRERHLGEADVADVRGDRARVAVQRELEPAAETRAVDGGDRRERQRADAREHLVPCADALARVLDAAELVDVGADAEHERLAGEDCRRPVALLELLDDGDGGLERGAAERRRDAVVLAVVDRDERDRAGPVQLEDGVSQRSPTGSRRPCPCRCRARSARSARRARASRRRAARRGARLSPRADARRRSRRRTD